MIFIRSAVWILAGMMLPSSAADFPLFHFKSE
jgi:hypothetical protein